MSHDIKIMSEPFWINWRVDGSEEQLDQRTELLSDERHQRNDSLHYHVVN